MGQHVTIKMIMQKFIVSKSPCFGLQSLEHFTIANSRAGIRSFSGTFKIEVSIVARRNIPIFCAFDILLQRHIVCRSHCDGWDVRNL